MQGPAGVPLLAEEQDACSSSALRQSPPMLTLPAHSALATPCRRVLVKEPAGGDIGKADVFRVNLGYSSRMYRVKINNLQMQCVAGLRVGLAGAGTCLSVWIGAKCWKSARRRPP